MINIPIYRDVNIYKICGGDKEKEFEELNSPFYRILATQSKLTNKNEDIRLCLIDDTFLRFIEANELEINKNSIATFINSLSDLEVKLLWDKYENNTDTINNIQKYCEENLAKYMLPKKFIVIKEFPKTMIGKIDYKELEKMYKGDK